MSTRIVTVQRRAARPADDVLLRELFEDTRPELALLSADTRFVLLDMQFRAQRRHFRSAYPDARREILVHEGRDAGCLILDPGGAVVRVVDLSVRRACRRRGIAATVLREVLAEARSDGREVCTRVWSGNVDALRLYERLGFTGTDATEGFLELRWSPRG